MLRLIGNTARSGRSRRDWGRTRGFCRQQSLTEKHRGQDPWGTMMVNYLELPVGEKMPEVINAVIEIPAEGINKYEYDKQLHVFRLDRNLYSPVHYHGDYGFIPSTLSED